MKSARAKNDPGFTIVELLIVIVVIAVLATISVVAYQGIQNRARSSAYKQELAQIEQQIAVYALQKNGETASIAGGSLIGFKENSGDAELFQALNGKPDITMYGVLKVIGASSPYSTYVFLKPLTWNTNVFSLDVGGSGSTIMRARVDTSEQLNLVVSSPSGHYVTGNLEVCWLEALHATGKLSLGCNQGAAHQTISFNAAHAGWNFTHLSLSDRSDKALAGLVFSGTQSETTRSQIVSWLLNKYGGV